MILYILYHIWRVYVNCFLHREVKDTDKNKFIEASEYMNTLLNEMQLILDNAKVTSVKTKHTNKKGK